MKRARSYLLGLLLLVAALPLSAGVAAPATTLQVSFIDVGQGDAILIRDLAGFDALIDGGQSWAGPIVTAYLREQGVDSLDVVLATHADADHVGGLLDVLAMNDVPVLSVLYNGYPGSTKTWLDFQAAVIEERLTLQVTQYPGTHAFGPALVQVLGPVGGLSSPAQNSASVVLRVSHGLNDLMLTGDIDAVTEGSVLMRGLPLTSEVLKVAHHGSAYSTSEAFLAAVQPRDAIISVGANSYGHPSTDTLARLSSAGARVWRTDRHGTVVVTSDGTGYSVLPSVGRYRVLLPLVTNTAAN